MATYYVRKSGSDSNAGTSAGAAWLTIGKALGAAGIASGDTVYIGAGVYREVVTVAMTSATAETQIIGDVTGQYTGDPGVVEWTAFTTDDKTAPGTRPLTLNGRDYLTFKNLLFVGGNSAGCQSIDIRTSNSTNITIQNCAFLPGNAVTVPHVSLTADANISSNLTIDSCFFFICPALTITLTRSGSADYDSSVLMKNCVCMGSAAGGNVGIDISSTGAGSFYGGGVDVFNCTFYAAGMRAASSTLSTSIPCTIYNSYILHPSGTGLNANTSGQIVEDYNVVHAGTARTNVTAGSNSIATGNYAHRLYFGWEKMWALPVRSALEPMSGAPILAFGAQGGGPSVDIFGATRPSGGASTSYAVGAYERGNFGTRETSVTHAGAAALKLIGPGYHDFQVPVDATSTTITIYARYDTNHAATNKPQISVLNGGGCGVSDATATMTAAVDTWEALALTFTPTAKGIVTIRCISRSAAGNGIAYFDS